MRPCEGVPSVPCFVNRFPLRQAARVGLGEAQRDGHREVGRDPARPRTQLTRTTGAR